jgi:hypothetical protein
MKVIFLDIDGVLNCKKTENPRKFPYVIDLELLDRLKGLAEQTEAKIVLTSTWRLDPIGRLAARHFGVPFIDCSPDMPEAARHKEIKTWLAENPDVDRFVVIDDECDGLDSLPLFQPDADVGLSYDIAVGVERYLMKESDETMRANVVVRMAQNIHSLFKRNKS